MKTFTGSLQLLCYAACIVLVHSQNPPGTRCRSVDGKPTCVCEHPDGRLDLTSLANPQGGGPKWTGIPDNTYLYSFNPCYSFNTQDQCQNVHVCQTPADDPQTSYDIADAGTEAIYYDDNAADKKKLYLYYTGPSDPGANPRETFVYLICDPSKATPAVTTEGDSAVTLQYVFHVTGSVACPGGGGGGVEAGLAGLIIMILLVLGVVLYFVIGAVIMKVKFEKTGTDIIPNKQFWIEFPLLIKDGVLFTFSPCVNAIQQRRGKGTYSSL